MFILIEHGELFGRKPRGRGSVLVATDRIERVGVVDRRALDSLGVE